MARRCAHAGCPTTISHTSPHRHCSAHRHDDFADASAAVARALAADLGFARRLDEETDASLRADPTRWVVSASAAESFSYAARSGDEEAIARSVRARERVARRRARERQQPADES